MNNTFHFSRTIVVSDGYIDIMEEHALEPCEETGQCGQTTTRVPTFDLFEALTLSGYRILKPDTIVDLRRSHTTSAAGAPRSAYQQQASR